MNTVAIICIVLGILIIVTRGPLIVAPQATVRVYRKILEKPAQVRIMGLALALLALVVVRATANEPGLLAAILNVLGWLILVVGGLMLTLFPNVAQSIVYRVLDALSDTLLRGAGLVAVGLGLFLIYLGVTYLAPRATSGQGAKGTALSRRFASLRQCRASYISSAARISPSDCLAASIKRSASASVWAAEKKMMCISGMMMPWERM